MRPKIPDTEKLDHGVRIRLTKLEKVLLLRRCQKEGYLYLSDFCRAKLVKRREIKKIEASPDFIRITKQLDYSLNKIGVNLNQVSKKMNTYHIYNLTQYDKKVFDQLLQELRNCFSVLQEYLDKIE